MKAEMCQLCRSNTLAGRGAPWGEGWICGECLNAYGYRAPYDTLDALGEVVGDMAREIAAHSGRTGANATAIQLARRVLESAELGVRLQSDGVPD